MRYPHLVVATALRGVVRRFAHGRDRSVSLEGRAYPRGVPSAELTCEVAGCGSPASHLVVGGDGRQIAVCVRCGEELQAILGPSKPAAPSKN